MTKASVLLTLIVGTLLGQTVSAQLGAEPEFREVASGFSSSTVQVRFPPDGSGRIFVVEQGGLIRIFDQGAILSTPFLNVASLVSGGSEQGLLGLAFHPDFAKNDTFFINYTDNSGDTNVVRYQVSAADPNVADSGSADPIIVIEQDFSNHNAGDLAFGPDGYLYIGLGDGGSGNDPRNRAQTISTGPGNCADDDSCSLLGAFLRIDVDSPPRRGMLVRGGADICGQVENYAIPPDNPFAGADGNCDEIWTYGWRNPFRFSFDSQTGDIFAGDVGQNAMEEISFMIAGDNSGRNFEWSCMEGILNNGAGSPCSGPGTQTPPIIPVPRNDDGFNCSIIGGYRYRGPSERAQGVYFFGDYCSGNIWYAEEQGGGVWNRTRIINEPLSSPVSFGEDEQGNLYVIEQSGTLYRLHFEEIFDDGFETPAE